MKKYFVALIYLAFTTNYYAQNMNFVVESPTLGYEFVGARYAPINKEKLQSANSILDINNGFPVKWISKYKSVTVSTMFDGKEISASGENLNLTGDQKKLLTLTTFGNDIRTQIVYDIENATTKTMYEETMCFTVSLAPAAQAEFPGGREKQDLYMKENGFEVLRDRKLPIDASLKFTIDKDGGIKNSFINKSSGKEDVDKILLNLIRNMPKWNPAKTFANEHMEQTFELVVNSFLGC